MALIAAKCTECGANIEVDETKEAGICKYCGTAFITEKVIHNYNMGVTNVYNASTINVMGGDINNLLKMAEMSLAAHNIKDADNYANKVLEINALSAKAWLIKMKAVEVEEIVGFRDIEKVNLMLSYRDNALNCSNNDDSIILDVYGYCLEFAEKILYICLSKELNFSSLEVSAAVNGKYISSPGMEDKMHITSMINQAYKIVKEIPENVIRENEKIQEKLNSFVDTYIQMFNGDTQDALNIFLEKLGNIIKGLPDSIKAQKRVDAKNKWNENVQAARKKANAQLYNSLDTNAVQKKPLSKGMKISWIIIGIAWILIIIFYLAMPYLP